MLIDDNLFCCLTEEQQKEIEIDIGNKNFKTVYHYQENLIAEKTGYRCRICGKFYPYLRIKYKENVISPEDISKLKGKLKKYKKAAVIFGDNYYYAQNKKSLLKFEFNSNQDIQQTDEISIMGDVYHSIISQNEKYIATESFRGTVGIIDVSTKRIIAKKQKCKINGSFIFSEGDKLLYYGDESIKCWDFIENKEEVIWEIPTEWKYSQNHEYPIRIVCNNVIYNCTSNTYLFQCKAEDITYIIVIKDNKFENFVQLTKSPALCKLVYVKELNLYTLVSDEKVCIYDENFSIIEIFAHPQFIRLSNGGGFFPVTQHEDNFPHRIFLSSNGKWILLDYFTSVILMKHEDYELKYCLYSYTGRTVQHMGFVDDKRFWYSWGDTTYIREIEE